MDQIAELPVMDRLWAWFQANKKQIAWVVGAVAVAGFGLSFYSWKKIDIEHSAADALSSLEATRALSREAHPESADAYLKIATEHAGTKAAARALLQGGGAYFVQGKYAEAQVQFQKFLADYPDNPLRGQAMLGIAACLDALAKPDEAAAAYKNVVDRHAGESVMPPAKFALARIYESQGKLEQAAKLYEELTRGEAAGTIANEAGLKAEELRAKLPAPAAGPLSASPTVAPQLLSAPSAPKPTPP